ncbi:hypothetical protein RhiirA5_500028 [Rhizophagus irregularis]|uniref:MULE transposase domain-containing protein n=1 Tax=Rhizophagus irregularis TaxID=588596 RepID=A0A2N0PNH6_9GLOM|nr:hypothetical protein RhiirA5_500028 [Rhizophagus irregularis]
MFTNADPVLDAAIPIIFSEIYPAHCIFHITQNLPKNLKAKLAGIESTAKVESYNWIIKQQLKANSTLSTTTNTSSMTGQDLFSIVAKILNKYLTEPINNTITSTALQFFGRGIWQVFFRISGREIDIFWGILGEISSQILTVLLDYFKGDILVVLSLSGCEIPPSSFSSLSGLGILAFFRCRDIDKMVFVSPDIAE